MRPKRFILALALLGSATGQLSFGSKNGVLSGSIGNACYTVPAGKLTAMVCPQKDMVAAIEENKST